MISNSWINFLRRPVFLLPLAFLIWTISFWWFLSGRISLQSDAISYYDHTKFFIEQLGRGQFPLWDPNWAGGVPNDFFLRRIGPYNPFLLVVLFFNKLGVKFFHAYMIFQAGYFFLGMTGFYLLCRKLLKDDSAAFISFLLLTFSFLGTRIFDSYMLLVTIPIIWFFYFLVSFFSKPAKTAMAGLTLALVLLLTTYVPLYFVVIFFSFLLVYGVVGFKNLLQHCKVVVSFIGQNKVLVVLCALAILLAAAPGLSFFSDAGKGGIAIPGRHYNTENQHVLAVEPQQLSPWSIMEEFFFSSYYTDLTRISFAIVYVPLLAFIILGAGIFVRLSRLFVLLFLWAMLLLLFSIPIGFPLYDFLYQHVGFIKYFRNLHFLLWFALLPIFALFVGEVWKRLSEQFQESPTWLSWVLVAGVHSLGFLYLMRQGDALLSTYASLAASLLVWAVLLSRSAWLRSWILPIVLVVAVIQPVEVFRHLSVNNEQLHIAYFYDRINGEFSHFTSVMGEGRVPVGKDVAVYVSPGLPAPFYFTTGQYQRLRGLVDAQALEKYEHYKFYLYDSRPAEEDMSLALRGEAVQGDTQRLRVTSYSANEIAIQADLEKPKFIVYNDVNYMGWSLKVNGKKQELFTANGAYKGFWLPEGKSRAVLRYGSWQTYLLNWSLMAVTCGLFVYIVFLFWRRQDA